MKAASLWIDTGPAQPPHPPLEGDLETDVVVLGGGMEGQLNWNSAERSWDCPCHGSRFAPTGEILQGPAVRELDRKPLE